MPDKAEDAAARWLGAVLHEVVNPTASAQLAVGLAAEHLERAVFALRRATQGADALRWLMRSLLQREAALTERLPCSVLGALLATVPEGLNLCFAVHSHIAALSSPGVLELVLGNLLANARRHAQGALVSVTARTVQASALLWPDGAQVRIRGPVVLLNVHDEGLGVTDPRRLFEPFATEGMGDGIGLWLCRLIVRAHGGDLWHEPDKRGASFTSAWPGVPFTHPGLWPDEPVALGRKLQLARAESYLTRAELGRRVDVSEATIRNVELGRHKVTYKLLTEIIQTLEAYPAGVRFWPQPVKETT